MKNVIKFLVLGVISLSCSSGIETEFIDKKLLSKIYKNGSLEREFDYYDNNKLKLIINYSNDNTKSSDTFYEYIGDTTIKTRTHGDNISYAKYYKIDENISRRDSFDENLILKYYTKWSSPSSNSCGFEFVENYNSNNSLNSKSTFTYSIDDNCSMTGYFYDSLGNFKNKIQQIRNEKRHFSPPALQDFFRIDNLGNIVNFTYWDENENVINERSSNSTFSYGFNGYPNSELRTYLDGTVIKYSFEYSNF